MSGSLNIQLRPLPDRQTLAAWWQELESRADLSFFTSWSWISVWLELLPETCSVQLLVAESNGVLAGLGLIVEARTRLLRYFDVRSWRLHTAGVAGLDELFIEYNDFLLARDTAPAVRSAMLCWMLTNAPRGCIEIRGAVEAFGDLAEAPPARMLARHQPLTTYQVSLEDVRASQGGCLTLLGSNSRSQIRRSQRAYASMGELVVEEATTPDEARLYMERLREMHRRRWEEKGLRSGFTDTAIGLRFHDLLVERGLPLGRVQLLRVRAGDRDIGYLYNFVYRDAVLFYQSGLNYDLGGKHGRPGLMCHVMAIDHNAHLGHRWYDMLAGDYRYKSSLATHRGKLAHCVFMRKSPLTLIDAAARRVRAQRRAAAAVPPDASATSPVPLEESEQ